MKEAVLLLALAPSLCLAAEPPASATPAPRTAPETPGPGLSDLLREAEANNPGLLAAGSRLDAARHVPQRMAAPIDPEIALTYVNDGVSSLTLGESEFANLGLTWSQEVRYPGKRQRAGAVAETGIEHAAAELRRVRLDLRAAVERAYAELYRIDRSSAILNETATVLDALARAARSRYEVGAGIQENVLKAETEVLKLEADTARLEQDRVAVVAEMTALLGRAGAAPIGRVTDLPPLEIPADEAALDAAATEASAAVASARAAVRLGEAAVASARYESKPDMRWSAGYQYRGDLEPMVMGMIGFRLPIHRDSKQLQETLEAEENLTAARRSLSDVELKTKAEARSFWARARRADRLVELYEKGIIVQARAAVASAQASYAVGRIDFLDLLNDLTVLHGARVEAVTQAAERMQAVASLETLTGQALIHAGSAPAAEIGSAAAGATETP